MAKRTVYDVSPSDDRWKVQRRGASRPSKMFDLKSSAIEYARGVAKNNRPSQLVVRREDGTIEEEWAYNGDPAPPSG